MRVTVLVALLIAGGCKEVVCQIPGISENALCVTEPGVCQEGRLSNGEFVITVVDSADMTPLQGVVVSIEEGCFYCAGHNAYKYGGISDAEGVIRVKMPFSGGLGIHTFTNGYLYGRAAC